MRVLQIGNTTAPHSTENELNDALRRLGCEVEFFHEEAASQWSSAHDALTTRPDMVLWTHTPGWYKNSGPAVQLSFLDGARRRGIPTVGYHLDRYWGLGPEREEILLRPFFSCDFVFTADGGHDDQFKQAGINHFWQPPAISERWCYLADAAPVDYDIVFVGGWEGYGHAEWTHRHELIERVRGWYGERFRTLPKRGQQRITMGDLNTIYASAKVVIGDSCLVPYPDGRPMVNYCSDRIPETLGRGGLLVHPFVEGVTDTVTSPGIFNHEWWLLGNWDDLHARIESTLRVADDAEAVDYRSHAIGSITEGHTYTHRLREVIQFVTGVSL